MSRTKESTISKAEKKIETILDRQRQREANRDEKIEQLQQMIEDAKKREQEAVVNNDEQAFKDARISREFAEQRLDAMNDFSVSLTSEERTEITDIANTALAAASLEARTELQPLLEQVMDITQKFHSEAFQFSQKLHGMGFSQVTGVTGGAAPKEVQAGYAVERLFRF